jgi:hypothetical protein
MGAGIQSGFIAMFNHQQIEGGTLAPLAPNMMDGRVWKSLFLHFKSGILGKSFHTEGRNH